MSKKKLEIDVARLKEKQIAAAEALVLAREIMTAWKAAANEWRDENKDQRALYPTSEKVEALLRAEEAMREGLEKRVFDLEKIRENTAGKFSAVNTIWIIASTVSFLLLAFLTFFYKH